MKTTNTKAKANAAVTTKAANSDAKVSKRIANAQAKANAAKAKAEAAEAAAKAAKAAPEAAPAKELSYHEKQDAQMRAFLEQGGKVTQLPSVTVSEKKYTAFKISSYDTLSKDHGVKLGYFRGYTIAAFIASGYLVFNDKESRLDAGEKGDFALFNHLTRPSSKGNAVTTACKTFQDAGAFSPDFRTFTSTGLNKVSASIAGTERYKTSIEIIKGMVKGITLGGTHEVAGRTFKFSGFEGSEVTAK